MIKPELIVTRLFCAILKPKESIIIDGTERFSIYQGYGDRFCFAGDYADRTKRGQDGILETSIVAIDALKFNQSNASQQFSLKCILRDLDKAYCGFYAEKGVLSAPPIATGNWGCGAFGGDRQLKAIEQLIAASEADREIYYFTFADQSFAKDLQNIHQKLIDAHFSVGNLWSILEKFSCQVEKGGSQDLFSLISKECTKIVH